jgi:hypothetical protein
VRRARVAVLRLSSAVGMAVACRGEGPGVSRVTVTWRPAAGRVERVRHASLALTAPGRTRLVLFLKQNDFFGDMIGTLSRVP